MKTLLIAAVSATALLGSLNMASAYTGPAGYSRHERQTLDYYRPGVIVGSSSQDGLVYSNGHARPGLTPYSPGFVMHDNQN